jgi:hypothetical protein
MAFGEALKNFFVGQPGQQMQFNRFTPQQSNLQNQSIQQILSLLQNGGGGAGGNNGSGALGQFNFEPIANRARSDFQTKTLPLLAERFSSLGSNKGSSGLPGEAGGAAQGLEEGLEALQSQHNLAAGGLQNQLLSLLLGFAMQPSFETAYKPSTPGLLQGLAGPAFQGLGSLGSSWFANRYLGE